MLAAKKGTFVGTFTGRLGSQAGADDSQPVIWSPGPIERQRGRQSFPSVSASQPQMVLSGRHVHQGARVYVNGRRVGASIELSRATHRGAAHHDQEVQVTLDAVPAVPRATQLVALGHCPPAPGYPRTMPSVESGVGHLATSRLMTLSGFKVAQGLDMIEIEVRDPIVPYWGPISERLWRITRVSTYGFLLRWQILPALIS